MPHRSRHRSRRTLAARLKRKARMACLRLHPISLAVVRSTLAFAKASALPDDLFEGLTALAEHDQIPVAADMLDAPAVSEVQRAAMGLGQKE